MVFYNLVVEEKIRAGAFSLWCASTDCVRSNYGCTMRYSRKIKRKRQEWLAK